MATQNHASFYTIYTRLTSTYNYPVLASASPYPHEKDLSHHIANLQLHPALECILHILNGDLTSAHFLLRHMQSPPAWEGMYIHGILHRIEGDYRNAEAWYGDVCDSECFKQCWPEGVEAAKGFIQDVERLRKEKVGNESELARVSKKEFDALVEWCKAQFGTDRWEDGTKAWVEPSEKIREMAAKQTMGGEGWRQF
ncbi:hypothetical protein Tdes44962_MAKER01250 [Teratosphaeria destructans]|uniref:Uncharacterized protein n=1 Tax=Teratosphaeria destructans TaxID=418781 RepID=A0A9W7W765_9PEZI|nr:hypothetical protein Tdes44962_MAKER01250 [Teratosphaeria destructans]